MELNDVKITFSRFFESLVQPVDQSLRYTTDCSGVLIQLAASGTGVDRSLTDNLYQIGSKEVKELVPTPPGRQRQYKVVTKYFKILNRKVIRFFEQTYQKHSTYASSHFFTAIGSNGITYIQADLGRFGDMIYNTYLSCVLPGLDVKSILQQRQQNYNNSESNSSSNISPGKWAWCPKPGNALISKVEMTVGSQKTDENDTNILNFTREYNLSEGRQKMYKKLIGDTPELTQMSESHPPALIYIPTAMFFNKSTACVLPSVRIQYHKLELYFQLRNAGDLIIHERSLADLDWNRYLQVQNFHLVTKQIFLSDEERFILTRNAVVEKEILFEKYQICPLNSNGANVITINHSVKELVWIAQMDKFITGKYFLYYTPIHDSTMDFKNLTYNATVRFVLKTAMYAKAYKFVPYQKGIKKAYTSQTDVNLDVNSFNKNVVQSRGQKLNQLEFAVLKSQAASFCPKNIVHFQTPVSYLTQVRELSPMEGVRVLDSSYVSVEQNDPIVSFDDKFVNLDHAYYRIRPVQSDCQYFNQNSVNICGDTLRIEEISIPVDWLIKYQSAREIKVQVKDKVQGFFFSDSQQTIGAEELKQDSRIIPNYMYSNNEIELYVFLTINGLQQVSFDVESFVYIVQSITVDSTSGSTFYAKSSTSDVQFTLEKYTDNGYYTDDNGLKKLDELAFNFGNNPVKSNYNIGISGFDVSVRQWDNYGMNIDKSGNPYISAELKCNGISRFTGLGPQYFNHLQPFECHINTPADGINIYSFAIKPEDSRPNGAMNFSRIESNQFTPVMHPRISGGQEGDFKQTLYAQSYNVLCVTGGAAVVKYAA